MTTIFKQSLASGYIQFQPGRPTYYLGECVDLDSIPNPRVGGIEPIQCRNRDGKTYKTVGKRYTPPGRIDITLTELHSDVVSWLEKIKCPFTLFATQRTCGDAGVFKNFERAAVVGDVEVVTDTLNQLMHHVDDNETMHEWSLSGATPRYDAFNGIYVTRETTTETENINAIATAGQTFCDDDCGSYQLPCDLVYAGCAAALGVTANVLRSADAGTTWAATAADPFAADEDILCIKTFEVSKGVNRVLAVRAGDAAAALEAAYSDDAGATWNMVTIGATNNEAPSGAHALFFMDTDHIWLATDDGRVFFSDDAGESFTDQASALTASGAAALNAVHFADEDNGVAVGDGDVVIITHDGGEHWVAGTATGTGDNLLTVVTFSPNRYLVGTNGVGNSLWMTFDGSTTWEEKTFTGSAAETAASLSFSGQLFGYLATNTAGPVGSIHRTIDGGDSWVELTAPTNSGLNHVVMCDLNQGFTVGDANGGTGFIGSFGS